MNRRLMLCLAACQSFYHSTQILNMGICDSFENSSQLKIKNQYSLGFDLQHTHIQLKSILWREFLSSCWFYGITQNMARDMLAILHGRWTCQAWTQSRSTPSDCEKSHSNSTTVQVWFALWINLKEADLHLSPQTIVCMWHHSLHEVGRVMLKGRYIRLL